MEPTIDEFVATRGAAMLRFAVMIAGDRPTAEDLLQSVLGRAYPRWTRIAAMQQPEAYLKKLLVNEHLRWRRRRSTGEQPATLTPSADGRSSVGPSPMADPARDVAEGQASRDAAWALLARLPRRQRAVLVLRYYEDLTDTAIAAVLGCQVSTVRSQAARGIGALRAALPHLDRELLP